MPLNYISYHTLGQLVAYMTTALITGALGLVGREAVGFYLNKFDLVIGLDNNQRHKLFGTPRQKIPQHPKYIHYHTDIRRYGVLEQIFKKYYFDFILAAAAQPSHDLAAQMPIEDFEINAMGTLNLLELTRKYCPDAVYIQVSTNKVYGDTPNRIPLTVEGKRFVPESGDYRDGINETMSIDQSTHSLFGVSKLYSDCATQEYGRYFGLKTGVFRGGCLTGSKHQGAKLHGFLNYLVKCAKYDLPYEVIGYGGNQVRDNIHAYDLITAFDEFRKNPRPAEVYNIGGGTHSNCSVNEAIEICETLTGRKMNITYNDTPRIGDHAWYISDVSKFQGHYPNWKYTYDIKAIIEEIYANI
jgi:CDP-paratose 2-epimerase